MQTPGGPLLVESRSGHPCLEDPAALEALVAELRARGRVEAAHEARGWLRSFTLIEDDLGGPRRQCWYRCLPAATPVLSTESVLGLPLPAMGAPVWALAVLAGAALGAGLQRAGGRRAGG